MACVSLSVRTSLGLTQLAGVTRPGRISLGPDERVDMRGCIHGGLRYTSLDASESEQHDRARRNNDADTSKSSVHEFDLSWERGFL